MIVLSRICWIKFLVMTFVTLLVPLGVWADQVILKNGDRLTGTVISMEKGKLVLKTSYAGKLNIKWAEVSSIKTDKPIQVELDSGKLLQGMAAVSQAPASLKLVKKGRPAEVELAKVSAINPKDKEGLTVTGEVNVGADMKRGNTHKDSYDVDGRVSMSWGIHRLIVGGKAHYLEDKGVSTEDNQLGYVEYNRFFKPEWYGLANLRLSRDKFKDLDLRAAAGLGLGHQFWRSKLTNLSFELGPNYLYEKGEIRGNREWTAARWQLVYDRWFFDYFTQFFHRHEVFLRADDFNQYFLTSSTGLKFPLGNGFAVTWQYDYDFDNSPQPGKEKYDTRMLLLLGYNW